MSFKDLLVRKVEAEEEVPAPPPSPSVGTIVFSSPPVIVMADAIEVDKTYRRLVAATDPSAIPMLKNLFALAEPLKGVIADSATRLKVVIAQTGVTTVDAAAAVDKLLAQLDAENKKFLDGKADATRTMVSQEAVNASNIQNQISALQVQLQASLAKVEDSKKKIAATDSAFNAALNKRTDELKQMKSDFTNLK